MSKLKILAVVPTFVLPSEVWMYRQLRYLAGHDQLKVIAYQDLQRPEFALKEADIVQVPESFNTPLRGWRRRVDKLIASDLNGPRFGRAQRSWLRQQIQDFAPDLIHCQYGTYGLSTLYVAKPMGVPVFTQFNGHDLTTYIQRKKPREGLIRHLNDFAGLVAVADYQKQWLLENGADSARIAMIPYGAPRETPRPTPREPRDRCEFLAVGRFCEMKAPLHTLRAFHRCTKEDPHCHLTMIGDGEMRDQVDQLIRELDLGERVTLMGFQTPEVVREKAMEADVFIQHSVTAKNGTKEGWPVAIGEAMSRGLPIISTRHAGIVQQVDFGVNGWLCDEHDWSSMASLMLRLIKDPAERVAMGRESLRLSLDSDKQAAVQREFFRMRCSQVTSTLPKRQAA